MLVPWYDVNRTFAELDAIRREMDAMLGTSRTRRRVESARHVAGPRPYARIEEHEDAYVLTAVLPGIPSDDIDLQVTRDTVHLKAERKVEVPEGFELLRRERRSWSLERTWSLPTGVDADAAQATTNNGELVVRFPKTAAVQPRRIEVK